MAAAEAGTESDTVTTGLCAGPTLVVAGARSFGGTPRAPEDTSPEASVPLGARAAPRAACECDDSGLDPAAVMLTDTASAGAAMGAVTFNAVAAAAAVHSDELDPSAVASAAALEAPPAGSDSTTEREHADCWPFSGTQGPSAKDPLGRTTKELRAAERAAAEAAPAAPAPRAAVSVMTELPAAAPEAAGPSVRALAGRPEACAIALIRAARAEGEPSCDAVMPPRVRVLDTLTPLPADSPEATALTTAPASAGIALS